MGRGRAAKTDRLIDEMIEIARTEQPCSVRAIAYRLFNKKLITSMSNKDGQVAKVSRLSVIAREEGLLPWEWIVDDTRKPQIPSAWDDPTDFLRLKAWLYTKNKWNVQPTHVE